MFLMRVIMAVTLACLICGCIQYEKPRLQYVCAEGQVVSSPGECPRQTTTTSPPQGEIASSTTSTTDTTSSSTTTSSTASTTTTVCDDSVRGYLLINDVDERCFRGYTFQLDKSRYNCTKVDTCTIGFRVRKPDGQRLNATAGTFPDGVRARVDDMTVYFFKAVKDRDNFLGVIKVV